MNTFLTRSLHIETDTTLSLGIVEHIIQAMYSNHILVHLDSISLSHLGLLGTLNDLSTLIHDLEDGDLGILGSVDNVQLVGNGDRSRGSHQGTARELANIGKYSANRDSRKHSSRITDDLWIQLMELQPAVTILWSSQSTKIDFVQKVVLFSSADSFASTKIHIQLSNSE